MLRILEVCTESAPAYALVFRRAQLINQLHPHLMQADILCSAGKEVRQMREQGIKVRIADLHRSLNPFRLLQSTYNLARIIKRYDYDVIHLHFGVPGLAGRILALLIRKPIWIYQNHGYSISANTRQPARLTYLAIERLLKHTVSFALMQSQEDMRIAAKYKLLTERQMIYLGNGIDTRRFAPSSDGKTNVATSFPLPQPLPLQGGQGLKTPGQPRKNNRLVFGMVARFEPIKNYQLLIDAIKHLRLKTTNFKVHMIGQGEQKALIAAQVAAHELYDLVEIHNHRQDMPAFYRQIDVGMLTSFGEGLPRALLEPMACGKPVICTDVKGSREAVIDGKTGFILPLGQPQQLADKMLWCIEHREQLPALGSSARQHVITHFSEQTVLERLSEVYLRCYQLRYAPQKLETQA